MTDQQVLVAYREQLARETLADARTLLAAKASPRSVVNRAYYAVFYAVLALLLRANVAIATSRHSGVLSLFDTTQIHTGLVPPEYSRIAHDLFDYRTEGDYRELAEVTMAQAEQAVTMAEKFCTLLNPPR